MSAYIEEQRERFGVEPICETLGVSASAYYQRATGERSARRIEDERLTARIGEVHRANYECYGYRRVHAALVREGESAGQRDFTATAPDRLWVGDLTYLRCWEGRLLLAFMIDVFSRKVIGWQLASHMRTRPRARRAADGARHQIPRRRCEARASH